MGEEPMLLPEVVVFDFVRVSTNPRAFLHPLTTPRLTFFSQPLGVRTPPGFPASSQAASPTQHIAQDDYANDGTALELQIRAG
jgi:hypothetical protein